MRCFAAPSSDICDKGTSDRSPREPVAERQGYANAEYLSIEFKLNNNRRSLRRHRTMNQFPAISRREALRTTAAGFGSLALAAILNEQSAANQTSNPASGPLAPRAPHFAAKATRIIFLFMEGAISQMDTFEYKPQLQQSDGKPGPGGGTLVASKFKFSQSGETGTWMSELLPNMAKHVDKLCFIRGLHTDTPAHPQAVIQLHDGSLVAVRIGNRESRPTGICHD
jgi:Protein of unknown function (DUF1501)